MIRVTRRSHLLFVRSILLAVGVDGLTVSPSGADWPKPFSQSQSNWLSGTGNILYLAGGTLLPLVEDGPNRYNHTYRVLDSMGASLGLAFVLKYTVREQRPGGGAHDSFPSAHATAAFAVATAQSAFHPAQAPFWYLGASAISISRLELNAHHAQDVIAGALIGYGMTRWELSRHHGLMLEPIINQDQHTTGLMIGARF